MVNETFSAISTIENLCAIDYDKIENCFTIYINDDNNIAEFIDALKSLDYDISDYDLAVYSPIQDIILYAEHKEMELRIEIIRLNN